MKIRIADIPVEGRHLAFDLDQKKLNERVDAARASVKEESLLPPEYFFLGNPHAEVDLDLEGSTVFMKGKASGSFRTICARCADEAVKELQAPVNIVLKPSSARSRPEDEDEDLQLGFYDGQEIDCGSIAEEILVLALPYTVVCKDECKGLCPRCGTNLNEGQCQCKPEAHFDERFSILQGLKIQ